MLSRRALIASPAALIALPARAEGSFPAFLAGVRAEARRAGISQAVLDRAFAGVQPNPKVIELDRKQPEFTMTWERYKSLVISEQRISEGRAAARANAALLGRIHSQFGVAPAVVMGIWGLESGYGAKTGGFNVIEALATLAWEGRRAGFFRGELMAALKILQAGDITPSRMTGSYAGAMGQPQFMPSSYLRLAVDFDGDGKRDIWNSKADALGSIANYLQKSGWKDGETWGQEVVLPAGFPGGGGRELRKPVREWLAMGVRPAAGAARAQPDAPAAILEEDDQAFMVFANFAAIRRYNPSDFYALAVGLIGDQVGA